MRNAAWLTTWFVQIFSRCFDAGIQQQKRRRTAHDHGATLGWKSWRCNLMSDEQARPFQIITLWNRGTRLSRDKHWNAGRPCDAHPRVLIETDHVINEACLHFNALIQHYSLLAPCITITEFTALLRTDNEHCEVKQVSESLTPIPDTILVISETDTPWENGSIRLRNDQFCIGWGVKLYSLTCFTSQCSLSVREIQ